MRAYLRVANVFEDRIDTTDVLSMNFSPAEFATYELKCGDVLLNEGQSLELVGRPAMYRNEVPGACFQNTLIRFAAYPGLEPRYALAVFLSYLHNQRFQKAARWTVNIAHLGAERLSSIEFPLPPIAEQRRIADEIERRLSVIGEIEAEVKVALVRADRLRQSTLKMAFEGKLVAQDATDEPASVLLEQIRAEREADSVKPRKGARESVAK
jgi:type I restriction enzyme S subunit